MKYKHTFFSRKNILIVTISVLMLYVLLWGGILVEAKVNEDRRLRAVKAKQDQVNSLSREERSIMQGEQYLVGSITQVKPTERLFLDYLRRKFNLDSTLGVAGPPIDLYENPKTYPEEIHYLARVAYPERIVNVSPNGRLEGVSLTNAYSANCDHIPLPDEYWLELEKDISKGDYYLTHVALALALMEDNGCVTAKAAALREPVMSGMVALANNPNIVADLRYEAVAFLLLSNRRDLVEPEWVSQITAEQRDDGGWSREAGGDKNDPHATLLALWAVLEYGRADTRDTPIIRPPSTPSTP